MPSDPGAENRHDHDPAGVSEEEVRKLAEQLRTTPAEQVVADVFSMTLNAATVKLGRRDARLFIDLCAVMVQYARPYMSDELGKDVERRLGQLRLGQVSAEKQVAAKGDAEANDLDRLPTPPDTGDRADAPPSGQAPQSSKLWVPGR